MSDPTTNGAYYKHSGRAPVGGLVMALVGGAVVTSLVAAVYAYFAALMPFIYLNMMAALIVGVVAGIVTGKLLVRGLVRNNRLAAAAGAAVGFVALYVAWAAWPYAILGERLGTDVGFVHLLTSPPDLWATIISINRRGAWRIGSSTPTGSVLWIAWVGEAAIIIGTSLFSARYFVADEVFCENCQRWCVAERRVLETHGSDGDELKRRLESKDFAYLAALGPRTQYDVEWFRFDLHRCQACENTATLTAKSVDLVAESGRVTEKTVIEKLLVSGSEAELLRHFEFDAPGPRSV
jgi:hypothetical protein